MRGRWWAAAEMLLWLLAALMAVEGVPVGMQRPFDTHNPRLVRLEGGGGAGRARREIEVTERPKAAPGSYQHAVSGSVLCPRSRTNPLGV